MIGLCSYLLFLHVLLIFGTVYRNVLSTLLLDRFWINQDVKYDFTADLTGIGDRSEYEKICET